MDVIELGKQLVCNLTNIFLRKNLSEACKAKQVISALPNVFTSYVDFSFSDVVIEHWLYHTIIQLVKVPEKIKELWVLSVFQSTFLQKDFIFSLELSAAEAVPCTISQIFYKEIIFMHSASISENKALQFMLVHEALNVTIFNRLGRLSRT